MMDSDLVMTCSLPSPLVRHQLAYLSINWPHDFHVPRIMYRLSFRLIQPLQLSIIYHNHLSPPLGSFTACFSIPTPSWIIFSCHRETIKSVPPPCPPIPPPLSPVLFFFFSPLLPALGLNLMSSSHFLSASINI